VQIAGSPSVQRSTLSGRVSIRGSAAPSARGPRDVTVASVPARRMLVVPPVRNRAGWVSGLIVATILAATFSCRQIAAIADNQATHACGLPFAATSCAACASTSCCAEASACAADPTVCSPYESCLGQCGGDPACRATCTTDYPVPAAGAAPVSALSACLASHCASECGIPCGGIAEYFTEPDAAPSCENCIRQADFCAVALACAASPACDAFSRCWLACPTNQCQEACSVENEAGRALFRPLYGAFANANACSTLCAYGSYWACAGLVQFPSSAPTKITTTEFVSDYTSGIGIADADISVCGSCPCSGSQILVERTTDENGYVTLSWNQDVGPTGGGSTYCFQTTAPGYPLTLAFSPVPFTESVLSVNDSLLAPQLAGIPLVGPSTPNPNGFNVGVRVFDCLTNPAPGVVVSVAVPATSPVDAGAEIDDGGGSADGQASVWDAAVDTNTSGLALFGPVPPGAATVTAVVPGVGLVSRIVANVMPDATTEIALFPTPTQ
jgi:hypothetical protein